MLESGRPATEEVVRHVDRCLSCLSCMTTCPSGVNYMHLVDHARTLYRGDLPPALARPAAARRAGRRAAAPGAVAAGAAGGAALARPFAAAAAAPRACWRSGCARCCDWRPRACRRRPATLQDRKCIRPHGARRGRVALLTGCAQTGARPRDQRGHHPAADAHGHRGGGRRGRRLLRRADPSHGPARPGDGAARGPTSTPGPREIGRRRAGRHRRSTPPAAARR